MKKSVYTGKMFKYLTIQRPILVIRVSKGVIKDLLEEIKASIYVTSTDAYASIHLNNITAYDLEDNTRISVITEQKMKRYTVKNEDGTKSHGYETKRV